MGIIKNFWQTEKNSWKIPLIIFILVISAFNFRYQTLKTTGNVKILYDRWTTQRWLYSIPENKYTSIISGRLIKLQEIIDEFEGKKSSGLLTATAWYQIQTGKEPQYQEIVKETGELKKQIKNEWLIRKATNYFAYSLILISIAWLMKIFLSKYGQNKNMKTVDFKRVEL